MATWVAFCLVTLVSVIAYFFHDANIKTIIALVVVFSCAVWGWLIWQLLRIAIKVQTAKEKFVDIADELRRVRELLEHSKHK